MPISSLLLLPIKSSKLCKDLYYYSIEIVAYGEYLLEVNSIAYMNNMRFQNFN